MRTPVIASAFVVALCACSADDLLLPDGAPAQLRMVSGDRQSAQVGEPVREPLIVEVLDRSGRPIPGTAVVFEFLVPADGAEISAPTTETDSSGQASAEVTLGDAVGHQPVVARLDDAGSDLQVQFILTALQRPPSPPSPPASPPSSPPTDGGGGGAGPAPPGHPSPPPDDGGGHGKDKGKDKHRDRDED